jgi:hypothetical protein
VQHPEESNLQQPIVRTINLAQACFNSKLTADWIYSNIKGPGTTQFMAML